VSTDPTPDPTPEQRPEGRLLAEIFVRRVPKISQREAARRAGISETRWRQIVQGYQQLQDGVRAPVTAPADTLARMAFAVGASEAELTAAGRADAAQSLAELAQPRNAPAAAAPHWPSGLNLDASLEVLVARASMQHERIEELIAEMSRRETELAIASQRLHEARSAYHEAAARMHELQELILEAEKQSARMRRAIEASEADGD